MSTTLETETENEKEREGQLGVISRKTLIGKNTKPPKKRKGLLNTYLRILPAACSHVLRSKSVAAAGAAQRSDEAPPLLPDAEACPSPTPRAEEAEAAAAGLPVPTTTNAVAIEDDDAHPTAIAAAAATPFMVVCFGFSFLFLVLAWPPRTRCHETKKLVFSVCLSLKPAGPFFFSFLRSVLFCHVEKQQTTIPF